MYINACSTISHQNSFQNENWINELTLLAEENELITPNYKESEVCLCEMGAAWVTSSKVFPFIVDPISYSDVGA